MRGLLLLLWLAHLSVVLIIGDARRTERVKDQCNKTVEIYEDVASPEVTKENWGKPMMCWYRFRPFRGSLRDWVLRIRFKRFKIGRLINATHCQGGYIQVIDGNGKSGVSNRKEPGYFCGEIEQPQTFISETSFVRLFFFTDNFTDQTYFSFDSRAEQQFEVYLRYGQHPELYPNRRGEVIPGTYCERVFRDCRLQTCYVQSPGYPGVYPRNLHCKYFLNTRLPFIKLYIENEEFSIDGQRCENIMMCPMRPISSRCPFDFIRIYDGKDETAPLIGSFCGMGKFPYSIIGTSQNLFVEFLTAPAGPLLNTGFHFNVGNWPGHVETSGRRNGTCDWVFTSDALEASGDKEGIFLSVAHWYPPHTTCTYLMKGRPQEVVRLYFPSFRINRIEAGIARTEGDCSESLTIYDASWADDARIIKTFCDTFSKPLEKHDFVSTSSALFVRFESKTGSYSGSSLYYWAHYDFFNDTRFGQPVPDTDCDEIFYSWRKPAGTFSSPLNTLVYKKTDRDIVCTYRFVTDARVYARVVVTVEWVHFKYNQETCEDCWTDSVDKVSLRDPSLVAGKVILGSGAGFGGSGANGSGAVCLCKESPANLLPATLVSRGSEGIEVQLRVDHRHAMTNYFKSPQPIFQGSYRFVHGPLCGPATFAASSPDGSLQVPHLDLVPTEQEADQPMLCVWEVSVQPERDLWLHFERLRFASRTCAEGKLEVFLPKAKDPFLTVCGDSASQLKEIPPLSAKQLSGGPLNVRWEASSPTRASFKLAWTQLFHLPRNQDGSLMTSPLTTQCAFACPGQPLCIPSELLCNGHPNCPAYNSTSATTDGVNKGAVAPDEDPELCHKADEEAVNWLAVGLGASGGALLAFCFLLLLCRACHKRNDDPY